MTRTTHRLSLVAVLVGTLVALFAFSGSASAYPPGSAPSISLNKGVAVEGSQVTVFGASFAPGTVDLSLHCAASAASSLGTANANSAGAFTQTVTLPAGVTGACQIRGTNAAGTASADITITETAGTNGGGTSVGNGGGGSNGGLSSTGVAVLSIGGLGLVLLLGGGVLLLAGRRRNAAV